MPHPSHSSSKNNDRKEHVTRIRTYCIHGLALYYSLDLITFYCRIRFRFSLPTDLTQQTSHNRSYTTDLTQLRQK
jgi:hypothetical protein